MLYTKSSKKKFQAEKFVMTLSEIYSFMEKMFFFFYE